MSKIRITFKDPDGVSHCVSKHINESILNIQNSLSDAELEHIDSMKESRREKIDGELERWIEYSEYITIEFDTEEGTAKVLEESN